MAVWTGLNRCGDFHGKRSAAEVCRQQKADGRDRAAVERE